MAQKGHYHFRRKGWGMIRNYWTNTRLKPGKQMLNPLALSSVYGAFISKGSDFSAPPAWLPVRALSSLGWFSFLHTALLGRYLMALESPTS